MFTRWEVIVLTNAQTDAAENVTCEMDLRVTDFGPDCWQNRPIQASRAVVDKTVVCPL